VDVLVIGHGICGAWLGYFLEKAGISFHVIDEEKENTASRIASGVINPVTGRRLVKTWMIDALLPFCRDAYASAARETGIELFRQLPLIDFHSNQQRKKIFAQRQEEGEKYLRSDIEDVSWAENFNTQEGYGIIDPCMLVNMRAFIDARKKHLVEQHQFTSDVFDAAALEIEKEYITYQARKYKKIIFCDGVQGFSLPWFANLPFANCKGEVLWIQIPELPSSYLFKKSITLVPWEKDIFWAGSSYEWSFEDLGPTALYRERCVGLLKNWLKYPFHVVDHKAAVRPATLERRPIVGFHPLHPTIGLLNGMGTKGCSLAPYFARSLTENLLHAAPLHPEADITRFF
jgi:glycine/D-amino acid oxidase-like deaminating enzyme